MYFNPSKAAAVLTFIGAVASIAAAPTSDEHNNTRHSNEKGVDYKDNTKHDKYSHVKQFEKHKKEIELQHNLTDEAADKYKFDDGKVGDKEC